MKNETLFWRTFAESLGFERREGTEIQGHSGLVHEFTAIAADDKSKRLLLVSRALDPTQAALVHSDIALTLPDVRILTARPILFDVQWAAEILTSLLGTNTFSTEQFGTAINRFRY